MRIIRVKKVRIKAVNFNLKFTVFLFYVFLNALLSSKGVDRKIYRREGSKGTPRPRNSTNKPPLFYQWRFSGHTGQWACTQPRAHLKGTLHQEPRAKS